jgi:hypothetical protein
MPDSAQADLSRALIALMKGVVYAESDPDVWQALLFHTARVRDYAIPLGLELMVDESEGYAYLRQRSAVEGEPELPRLVSRRPLGYGVSLLLVLLRKKLAESDAKTGEARLILSRDDILELARVFLPDAANEARQLDRVESHINKVVEMGFLRRLRGREDQFEIRRILKAFVDAQWIGEFEKRLDQYRQHGSAAASDMEAP